MEEDDDSTLRVLEFYSGIGGLRYSLANSGVKAVVVEAFDINDVANDVYEHNFGHRPNQGNIQGLSAQQLDRYKADAWLLSPPCQPYTRQGLQQDVDDARATSFLKMLQLLPLMALPPSHVLVENVVGFENSITHSRLLAVLENAGLVTQEFILSPLQFGIPYSRPRYFCLAKRTLDNFMEPEYNGQLLCNPGPLLNFTESHSICVPLGWNKDCKEPMGSYTQNEKVTVSNQTGQVFSTPIQLIRNEPYIDPAVQCRPVGDYLEVHPIHALEEGAESQLARPSCREGIPLEHASRKLEILEQDCEPSTGNITRDMEHGISKGQQHIGIAEEDQWEPYKVPMNVVNRWIDAYDIVTPESRRCCCFTKSYTRYAKGTGSFLATNVRLKEGADYTLENHIFDLRLGGHSFANLDLRYFTPREVANLHSFPDNFRFPAHVRLKQRYALLGNSLSVAVVSSLLRCFFGRLYLFEPCIFTKEELNVERLCPRHMDSIGSKTRHYH